MVPRVHCIGYVSEHLRARALRSVGDSIKVLARARLNGGRRDGKQDESNERESRSEMGRGTMGRRRRRREIRKSWKNEKRKKGKGGRRREPRHLI